MLTETSSTYLAFDTKNAGALTREMKKLGVNIGTCGKETVRLRPMLIFEESHSEYQSEQDVQNLY